ncbi:MAG: zinc-dependent metalloproteinase lipoprotein [Lachnospiraceae bacterium]
MKFTYTFLLSFLIILFSSCEDKISTVEVFPSSFKTGGSQTTIQLQITGEQAWRISSDATWCTPKKSQGIGCEVVDITLTPNTTLEERTATLTITYDSSTLTVQVLQNGEYHYQLPLVFHVLYKDINDPIQYVEKDWIPQLIDGCNQMYANKLQNDYSEKKGVDLNLEFTLATTDPDGNKLQEPGVNRIQYPTSTIDCTAFMYDSKNTSLLWDLDRYINVFLYTFTEPYVAGISNYPYATSLHPLDGLYNGDIYINDTRPSYPHCLSINNIYIYNIPQNSLDTDNIITTLAHELGHYLGLLHAFGVDNAEKKTDWKTDTDYCDDTPNYDRVSYEQWLSKYLEDLAPEEPIRFSIVTQRTSSTGETFSAHNIMDYYYGWADEFTPDQRKRVRHVLNYSPLIPGPKDEQRRTRSATDLELPPARTIK